MEKIKIRAAAKIDMNWINDRYKEVDFVPSVFEKEVIGIAQYQGQPAGIGRLVKLDAQHAELGGMYVFEPFRGKGIATELVKFLLDHARSFETVYCIPFEHLSAFYMGFGFHVCEDLEKVPCEIQTKYQWCQNHYPQATKLLSKKISV